MTKEEIIDNLELYTVGRLKKDRVSITVEELQNLINEIKTLEQNTVSEEVYTAEYNARKQAEYELWKIKEQQPCDDCVSRKAVAEIINKQRFGIHQISMGIIKEKIESLPLVTPTRSTCKDCRWLTTDEDGNYYCRQTWDFDSLDFYCADFEKRGDSNGSN